MWSLRYCIRIQVTLRTTVTLGTHCKPDSDGYPDDDDRIAPSALDLNPLHILCPVCSLLQFLVGGVLSGLLGNNLLKQLGIFVCSLVASLPLKIPFLPNILCTVVVEVRRDFGVS